MKYLTAVLALGLVAAMGAGALGDTLTFDTSPVLSNTQAAGVWYTDRYAPAAFESVVFDGDSRLRHGIAAADLQGSAFYNTQGRKYDTNLVGAVQEFSIDMYVGSDWGTATRYAGLWATGFDASNAVSAYPILAYRNAEGDSAGFYTYDYLLGGWTKETTDTDFGQWYNLRFVLTVGTGVEYFVNGVSVRTFADPDTLSLGNVILNAKNYGQDYDVYWDNFNGSVVPLPAAAWQGLAMLGSMGGLAVIRRRKSA